MARIRTIKPEFTESESMGRVSREARLLFVLLWTIADDAGKARGHSRSLASRLYQFDDDAPRLIDGWLTELEQENCVQRYLVDGMSYLRIVNWLDHQKIDRPSKSRLPDPDKSAKNTEHSTILASPRETSTSPRRKLDASSPHSREPSSTDLVPSTLDLGPEDSEANASEAKASLTIINEILPASKPVPEHSPQVSALPTPLDVTAALWGGGLAYLIGNGVSESHGRSVIGKWRKAHGELAVLNALSIAQGDCVSDPIPYVTKVLNSAKGKTNGTASGQHGQATAVANVYRQFYANARAANANPESGNA